MNVAIISVFSNAKKTANFNFLLKMLELPNLAATKSDLQAVPHIQDSLRAEA